MNKNDLMILIMAKKTLDYQKDPNPENWRTIKGAKVHIDENGKIDGGAGGKFNGKGALPRSMFSESGKGKQTEFAEVTAKKNELAEQAQKEKETQKAERKKERADAQKAKREEKRKLEKERPELKKKFEELRESYLKESDPKKKRELRNQALEASQEYFKKYGTNPDDDGKPEEKPATKTPEVGEKGMAFLKKMAAPPKSSFGETASFMASGILEDLKAGKSLEQIRKDLHDGIKSYDGPDYEHEMVDKMIADIKRADKGEAKEPKLGAPKEPKKEKIKKAKDLTNIEIRTDSGKVVHNLNDYIKAHGTLELDGENYTPVTRAYADDGEYVDNLRLRHEEIPKTVYMNAFCHNDNVVDGPYEDSVELPMYKLTITNGVVTNAKKYDYDTVIIDKELD